MMQRLVRTNEPHQTLNAPDSYVATAFVQELFGEKEPLHLLFERVERAKQEWEATADALPQLLCLIDDQGRVLRANRTVEAWNLGQVMAVQGLYLHELIHPHCSGLFCYLDRFLQYARAQTSQGQPAIQEAFDAMLNRHVLIRVQPVLTHQQAAPGTAVVVIHDITEHKQTADALQRYTQRLVALNEIAQAILAARSPEAIAQAALSRIRRLVPFRQARVTLRKSDEFWVLAADANGETHLRPGESLPAEAFGNNQERQPDRFFVIQDLAMLSERSVVEEQLLSEGIRSYVSLPLVADGESLGSFSLGANHPAAFEQEHLQIACEVVDLLAIATRQAQLRTTLEQANAELETALRAKEDMVQNVSHELRTPLTMIYGYTELLQEGELGPLTDEQSHILSVMRQQGDQLRFMVDRLLALQTFDAKRLECVPLDLSLWLDKVTRSLIARATKAPQNKVAFSISPSMPPTLADPDLLRQVMVNLLDNAIKFSPQGGTVRVRAWAEGDRALITVSDEGIGIAPDKLEKVFDRFYQVDGSTTRRFGGMGIGLALCREIVQAHGGRIWAESQGEGQGSTFYVSLPLTNEEGKTMN